MKKLRLLVISLSAGCLSACNTTTNETVYTAYQPYKYEDMQYYTQTYSGGADYSGENYPREEVTVPDSYHVGAYHSPTRAKDRDKNWVSSQNPQGYTIMIAEDEKPSKVAGKLYQLPKNDRMAEIKYQRDGKNYYQGVYGSYSSQEEAQKALDALPAEVKQQAGVKNWNSVQSNISE